MLVTLANNQTIAANSSATYTYSPNSLQKVLLNIEDADWEDCTITVQIGSTTILNGVSMYGLAGLSALNQYNQFDFGQPAGFCSIDFGNHILFGNDNLYVTIHAMGETTAVDVSAIVNKPDRPNPLRLTEYSDNTFTSTNNLFGLCWDFSKAVIDEDSNVCEIRTSADSSAPSFISSSSYYQSQTVSSGSSARFGILNEHPVPLHTTYNYSSSGTVDRILTIEKMSVTRNQVSVARQSFRRTVSLATA